MKLAVIGSTGLVGSQLVALAESRGHVITGISKDSGVDLLAGTGLEVLAGIDSVVNVIQSPNLEEQDSTKFFTTVASNLGRAAAANAVGRFVVLSIIAVDRVAAAKTEVGTGYDGYYKAKYAQERATVEDTPHAHVVRSAQFHDLARQAIGWGRNGDTTTVPDLTIQPLSVAAMVGVLLDVATGVRDGNLVEVAGPKAEHLAAMSTAYARHEGDDVQVVSGPVGDAIREGILLPGADAILAGPTFDEWLATQGHS